MMKYTKEQKKLIEGFIRKNAQLIDSGKITKVIKKLNEDLGDGTNPQIILEIGEADFNTVKKAISETYPLLAKELKKLNFEPTYSVGSDFLIPGLRNDEGIYIELPFSSGSRSSTKFRLSGWGGPDTPFYGMGIEYFDTPEEVIEKIKELMAEEKIKKQAKDKAMNDIKVRSRANLGSGINEYEILDFKFPYGPGNDYNEPEFDFDPVEQEDTCTEMINQAYPNLVRELNNLGFEYEYDESADEVDAQAPYFINDDLEVILPHKNRFGTQKFFEFTKYDGARRKSTKFKTADELLAFLKTYL